MAKYKLTKNRNNSTMYDNHIQNLEGIYDSQREALATLTMSMFETTETPDGAIWVYPAGTEDVEKDTEGYHMLAVIEEIV